MQDSEEPNTVPALQRQLLPEQIKTNNIGLLHWFNCILPMRGSAFICSVLPKNQAGTSPKSGKYLQIIVK
jgi:hypothetical protein